YPGETIRKQIAQKIPGVKHAFIIPAEGVPRHKGTLGIEHASVETIQEALKGLYDISEEKTPTVSKTFLREMSLTRGHQAKVLLIQLDEAVRLGYINGKQRQKR